MNFFTYILYFLAVDSWGNFPSGIFGGNFFDLGSFSQCFHIIRNESAYESQYCIGQLKFRGQIEMNTVKPQLVHEMNSLKLFSNVLKIHSD